MRLWSGRLSSIAIDSAISCCETRCPASPSTQYGSCKTFPLFDAHRAASTDRRHYQPTVWRATGGCESTANLPLGHEL
jgi:hypothetical protein